MLDQYTWDGGKQNEWNNVWDSQENWSQFKALPCTSNSGSALSLTSNKFAKNLAYDLILTASLRLTIKNKCSMDDGCATHNLFIASASCWFPMNPASSRGVTWLAESITDGRPPRRHDFQNRNLIEQILIEFIPQTRQVSGMNYEWTVGWGLQAE